MLGWAMMRSQFKAIAWLCVRTPEKTRYAWQLVSLDWQWMGKMSGHGLWVLAAQVAPDIETDFDTVEEVTRKSRLLGVVA